MSFVDQNSLHSFKLEGVLLNFIVLGTSGTLFNAPSTSRYTIKKYTALAVSELQDQEDELNREFGVKNKYILSM